MDTTAQATRNLQSAILDQIATGEHYLVARDAETAADFDSLGARVNDAIRSYGRLGVTSSENSSLDNISQLHQEITAAYIAARADVRSGRQDAALAKVEAVRPRIRALRSRIAALSSTQQAEAISTATLLATEAQRQNFQLLKVLSITALLAILLGFWTMRAINKPLDRLVVAANDFGTGELRLSLNGRMPAEFRVL